MIFLSGVVLPGVPAMVTPRMRQLPPEGVPWAADTGCYASPEDHEDGRYLAWLARLGPARALFATAPDVVGDAAATLARSAPMLPRLRALGFPAALVAQDGLERLPVPWPAMDALFLGGTTAWKLSEAAAQLVTEARARGLWTHMGRVNSLRRFRHAVSIGCDSADGTILRYGPAVNRTRVDGWAADQARHPMLWG